MIERAIELRKPLTIYCARSSCPREDVLNNDNWDLLLQIKELLKDIYKITMTLQGRAQTGYNGALWEVLISLEFLLGKLEKAKKNFDQNGN
jgi:hypothetical protein